MGKGVRNNEMERREGKGERGERERKGVKQQQFFFFSLFFSVTNRGAQRKIQEMEEKKLLLFIYFLPRGWSFLDS